VIKYKVQCQGVIGEECRRPRPRGQERPLPSLLIGTWLCKTYRQAQTRAAMLIRDGYEPKVVAL
jgi:hypothetical protein